MVASGLWTTVVGLVISVAGTLLLFGHVTSKYNSHIQDMGSIAVGYLGLILLGLTVSVTGVALLVRATVDPAGDSN